MSEAGWVRNLLMDSRPLPLRVSFPPLCSLSVSPRPNSPSASTHPRALSTLLRTASTRPSVSFSLFLFCLSVCLSLSLSLFLSLFLSVCLFLHCATYAHTQTLVCYSSYFRSVSFFYVLLAGSVGTSCELVRTRAVLIKIMCTR